MLSRDETLDEFLARSADVLENWQGSDDAMSVQGGSVGGLDPPDSFEIRDGLDGPAIAVGGGYNGWIRSAPPRAVGSDHVDWVSAMFDTPREMLAADDLMFPEVRLRAQTEAFARAVNDTLFRQAAIDVADRIPDSVMQMRSKDHAVECILREAVAAGWVPPMERHESDPAE